MTGLELRQYIEDVIQKKFISEIKRTFSLDYYKNQYLLFALERHTSPQCIVRTYIEALKSGFEYTQDSLDLKHMNMCLRRLNMVHDKELLDFLNTNLEKLKEATYREFSYLIIDSPGRIKSFRSFEAKARTKIAMSKVLSNLAKDQELFKEFSEEEKSLISELLMEKLTENAKSVVSDTFGLRSIIYSFERRTDEEFLKEFVPRYADFVKEFFDKEGFDIVEDKDYVKNPKQNGYQSRHLKIDMAGIPFEIQIRTIGMHEFDENGAASHEAYKNNDLQNFLKDFLYKASGSSAAINEKTGLLKEQTLNPTIWCFASKEPIPKTPLEVAEFEDMKFLESIFFQN